MAKREEWVRVKDESELRAGMVVQIRPCKFCGRTEQRMLLKAVPLRVWTMMPDGRRLPSRQAYGWIVSNRCSPSIALVPDRNAPIDPADGIADGRWYRLADDQLLGLSETRELENVR